MCERVWNNMQKSWYGRIFRSGHICWYLAAIKRIRKEFHTANEREWAMNTTKKTNDYMNNGVAAGERLRCSVFDTLRKLSESNVLCKINGQSWIVTAISHTPSHSPKQIFNQNQNGVRNRQWWLEHAMVGRNCCWTLRCVKLWAFGFCFCSWCCHRSCLWWTHALACS